MIQIKHRYTNAILLERDLESLVRADLSGANLREADLHRANLSGANLSGADLSGADLGRADLSGANLREADLYGADLREADLYGADLYGANLREADLYGADLREADLYGADLYGVNLRGANLRQGFKIQSCLQLTNVAEWGPLTAFLSDKGKVWIEVGCRSFSYAYAVKHWEARTDRDRTKMAMRWIEEWRKEMTK